MEDGTERSFNFIDESLSLNRFWLRIMKEHSIFLRLGLPCDRQDLIDRAAYFESRFDRLLARAQSIGRNVPAVRALNDESILLTRQLIEFKTQLLMLMVECRLGGFNFPLLIDHIRREAIRFVDHLIRLQEGQIINPITDMLAEDVFWTRIMADHSAFILHLLDPSERQFIEEASEFREEFDELRLQSQDFESMLRLTPVEIPSLKRFNDDLARETVQIIAFKSQLRELINRCEILSLIPELLMDHVLREAEHFLRILREATSP